MDIITVVDGIYRVGSEKMDQTGYVVQHFFKRQKGQPAWACSCPHFHYRCTPTWNDRDTVVLCKHIKAVQEMEIDRMIEDPPDFYNEDEGEVAAFDPLS